MILAIDPGPAESALITRGPNHYPFGEMLENRELARRLRAVAGEPSLGLVLAIEMVASYGMPVGAEVFETCVWIGRFAEAFHPSPTHFVYRKDVKLHLCGNLRAKDSNIRQALIDKLGPVGTKRSPGPCYGLSGDLWSALAVAVTFAETAGSPSQALSVASVSSGAP